MSTGVSIRDEQGHTVGVDGDGALSVAAASYPPLNPQKTRPFRQFFTADGTPTGSNDMGVNGSVTPQDFWVPADPDVDTYITTVSIIVAYGASGDPYQWADGAALTNGVRFYYTSLRGEVDIHEGIKTNQDMFRLDFNAMRANWEVGGVNANNDFGYFINVNFLNFGMPFGLKLDRRTAQRLVFSIRDNAGTAADTFNAIAYGFTRFA